MIQIMVFYYFIIVHTITELFTPLNVQKFDNEIKVTQTLSISHEKKSVLHGHQRCKMYYQLV